MTNQTRVSDVHAHKFSEQEEEGGDSDDGEDDDDDADDEEEEAEAEETKNAGPVLFSVSAFLPHHLARKRTLTPSHSSFNALFGTSFRSGDDCEWAETAEWVVSADHQEVEIFKGSKKNESLSPICLKEPIEAPSVKRAHSIERVAGGLKILFQSDEVPRGEDFESQSENGVKNIPAEEEEARAAQAGLAKRKKVEALAVAREEPAVVAATDAPADATTETAEATTEPAVKESNAAATTEAFVEVTTEVSVEEPVVAAATVVQAVETTTEATAEESAVVATTELPAETTTTEVAADDPAVAVIDAPVETMTKVAAEEPLVIAATGVPAETLTKAAAEDPAVVVATEAPVETTAEAAAEEPVAVAATKAPVETTTEAAVKEPVVVAVTDAPVEATEASYEEPAVVAATTEALAETITAAATEEPVAVADTEAPVLTTTEAAIEEPAVVAATEAPVETTTDAPVAAIEAVKDIEETEVEEARQATVEKEAEKANVNEEEELVTAKNVVKKATTTTTTTTTTMATTTTASRFQKSQISELESPSSSNVSKQQQQQQQQRARGEKYKNYQPPATLYPTFTTISDRRAQAKTMHQQRETRVSEKLNSMHNSPNNNNGKTNKGGGQNINQGSVEIGGSKFGSGLSGCGKTDGSAGSLEAARFLPRNSPPGSIFGNKRHNNGQLMMSQTAPSTFPSATTMTSVNGSRPTGRASLGLAATGSATARLAALRKQRKANLQARGIRVVASQRF